VTEETGLNRHRGTYNWPLSWDQEQVHARVLWSNQGVLAHSKIEINWKIKRVGPLGPRSTARESANQVAWLACGCAPSHDGNPCDLLGQ